MAWDTELTRKKLLDAATAHFSATGFSGTRIDAIASEAGVNKERIYSYFGNKAGLFEAVLIRELDGLLSAVRVEGSGPVAVGEYAGALFDCFRETVHLPRLLAWEGLEHDGRAAGGEIRKASCLRKVGSIATALPGVEHEDAAQLLLSVITLASGWWALPQMGTMILSGRVDEGARRSQIVAQAQAWAHSLVAASPVG